MRSKNKIFLFVVSLLILRPFLQAAGDYVSIGTLSPDSVFLGIALVSILIYNITHFRKGNKLGKEFNFIKFAMILYVGTTTISLFQSSQFFSSFTFYLQELLSLLVFISIIKFYKHDDAIQTIKYFIVSILFYALDIVLDVLITGGKREELGESYFRSDGYLTNLGAWVFGVLFLYAIYVCFFSIEISKRDSSKMKYFLIVTFFILLLFSGSRSSILSLFAFLAILFLFSARNLKNVIRISALVIVILITGAFLFSSLDPDGFARLSQSFSPDYYAPGNGVNSTALYRIILMREYLFNWSLPIFGFGQRSYAFVFDYTDPGSQYVLTMITLGIVGLVLFFLLNFSLFAYFYRYRTQRIAKVILAVMISLIIVNGGESALVEIRGYYYWVMMGIFIVIISNFRQIDSFVK
ncbi:MAG: O-antigen ligase family protein [Bacteroidota bacterium]